MTVVKFRNKANPISQSRLFEKPKTKKEPNEFEEKLRSALTKLQYVQSKLEILEKSTSYFFDRYYESLTSVDINSQKHKSRSFYEIIDANKELKSIISKIYQTIHEICPDDHLIKDLDKNSSTTPSTNYDLFSNLVKLEEYLSGSNILSHNTIWHKISDMELRCLNFLEKTKSSAIDDSELSTNENKRHFLWCTVCCEELFNEIKYNISNLISMQLQE